LQSIGKDDVGVHGCDVDMVDQWKSFELMRTSDITEAFEFIDDLRFDFGFIRDIVEGLLRHFD
jgi:hypothetical protein